MTTLRRWLTIMLTCRWGWHKPMLERLVTTGVKVRECPRCHRTVVSTRYGNEYQFNTPRALDVARGLYDRPQDHWGGE